nr:lipid phosphate phosphatase 2-like [Tanacetum cinerariifolium]
HLWSFCFGCKIRWIGYICWGRRAETGKLSLNLFYMQSHGRRVARIHHMHDSLILILLAVIEVGLNVIHPFYRFVGKDMMTNLKYPLKENTIPFWAVPIYAVILPIVVFLFIYIRRRDVHDLHHAILGLLFSVLN